MKCKHENLVGASTTGHLYCQDCSTWIVPLEGALGSQADLAMDPTHRENLRQLIELFSKEVTDKYEKGVSEHGGHLWRKGMKFLVNAAYEEAVDQVIYLGQLKQIIYGIESDEK